MKISTLTSPLLECPEVQTLLQAYTRATDDQEISFRLSADRTLAQERVGVLLKRTGEQIDHELVPKNTDLCGACHEVDRRICDIAQKCKKSFCNPHCLHTDYAGINPFIDSMLFVLYYGGFLTEDKFLHASAYLRVLGKRKYLADQMAGPSELDLWIREKYAKIFGSNNSFISFADFSSGISIGTGEGRITRNKLVQTAFHRKTKPLLDEAQSTIKEGLRTEIKLEKKDDKWLVDLKGKIQAKMIAISPKFWEISSIFGEN